MKMRSWRNLVVAVPVAMLLASCGNGPATATIPVVATPATTHPQITAEVTGTLTSVFPQHKIVNITTPSGSVLVLSLAVSARVTLDGADTTLANLADRIGSAVTAKYNPANNIATIMDVSSHTRR